MITTFDGHIHVPRYRVNATLLAAVRNGLDSLMFTDRNNTDIFDSLRDGSLVLDDFAIHPVNARYLIAYSDQHSVDIYRGQEPRTKQGDVLIWGGSKPVEPGRDIEYTIDEAIKDGAHVVLAHPFAPWGSVGTFSYDLVDYLLSKFPASDLTLEMNAQFPCLQTNKEAILTSLYHDRFPWSNSDTHGHYRQEHKKLGVYLHNLLPFDLGLEPHDALRELAPMHRTPDPSTVTDGSVVRSSHGRLATPLEVLAWNAHSFSKNPVDKVRAVLGLNE